VQRQLAVLGIPFRVNPRMVRGIDYYTAHGVRVRLEDPVLGTASAVGGGGRYDRLVKELGGPDTPAVGWALGMDRLCLLLQAKGTIQPARPELFVAVAEEGAADAALALVEPAPARRAPGGLRRARREPQEPDEAGRPLGRDVRPGPRARGSSTSGEAQLKPLAGGEPLTVQLDAVETALAGRR
jgi:histidyl-tRNA synthetase